MHQDVDSHEDVIRQFEHEGFRIGVHKAFQIARDAQDIQVILISDMEPEFVRKLLLHPAPNLDEALRVALADLSEEARIGIMPVANATIPVLKTEQ